MDIQAVSENGKPVQEQSRMAQHGLIIVSSVIPVCAISLAAPVNSVASTVAVNSATLIHTRVGCVRNHALLAQSPLLPSPCRCKSGV